MPEIKVTYAQALADARTRLTKVIRNKESAFREAEAILLHTANITREKLYTILRDIIPTKALKLFINATALRCKHIPLQYITGTECFYGREFKVKKGVFIPRPDTEAVIEAVLSIKKLLPFSVNAADCGSGSGILSITLIKEIPNIKKVLCFDSNKKALDLTLANALTHGVSRCVKLYKGDFFALCKRHHLKFDLLVSNPPYIRLKSMKTLQKEVLQEPHEALTDGALGYSFYKKFAENGATLINPGGFIVMEIGDKMGNNIHKLFNKPNWKFVNSFKDFREKERVLVFKHL
ncbi:MAG: peptide chain release factor N(5)-glutamine methyltransferase [bacterium]